jgi:phage repressor protein C with HTH and peptisase S24 domain
MDIANGNIDGWACVPSEVLRASCKTEAFRVIGDSMYPNLQDGDIVGVCIFDMPPDLDNLDPDIIYFCQIDNDYDIGYTLKRAKVANNRYLTLIPENKKHDVMILDLWEEKGYSPIIGRVVWIWREL